MEEILHQLDNIVFFCMIYRVRYIKWCQVSFINTMGASDRLWNQYHPLKNSCKLDELAIPMKMPISHQILSSYIVSYHIENQSFWQCFNGKKPKPKGTHHSANCLFLESVAGQRPAHRLEDSAQVFPWWIFSNPELFTPWKINMELTNHPFRKENHLPKHHFQGIQGCIQPFWGFSTHQLQTAFPPGVAFPMDFFTELMSAKIFSKWCKATGSRPPCQALRCGGHGFG